jgi:sideroflexin-5
MRDLPLFSFTINKYDQSTLLGRIKHFYRLTNPLTLFTSNEKLNESILILNKYKQNKLLNEDKYMKMKKNSPYEFNNMLWEARDITESILHPDTNKPISPFFRFSFFGPAQFIIIPFIISSSTIASPFRTVIAHWANQSYNAGCNFSNRNISKPTNINTFTTGYIGAVVSSVCLGLGATAIQNKVHRIPKYLKSTFRIGFPFLACAIAGCANLILVRKDELSEGIMLFDNNKNEIGKSTLAARTAIIKCCAARFAWNVPIMIGVPLILSRLYKLYPLIRKRKKLSILTTVLVSGFTCMVAVPPALALFPQYDSININKLEDKYKILSSKTGIKELYFNKGL